MSDDSPDSLLGALLYMVIGLSGMALSLALLVAMFGAAFHLFFGSAPAILEPFGGTLAVLIADFLKLMTNLAMIVIAIAMVWLMMTGKMDEVVDEMVEDMDQDQRSPDQGHHGTENTSSSSSKPKPQTGESTPEPAPDDWDPNEKINDVGDRER